MACHVVAIVLDLPAAVIRAQNEARERVVGDDVIERHLAGVRRTIDRGELQLEGASPVIVLRTTEEARTLGIARIRA